MNAAQRHRVPAIYGARDFVAVGGLMSYSAQVAGLSRRAAEFADRILRGADLPTLPVEQPTKFELVINLKTAKALGIEVPPLCSPAPPAPVTREPGSKVPVRALLVRIPLGPRPSLQQGLRCEPPPCRTPPQGALPRFVRRLHSYYDEVRLLVSVHHRLRLLTFPDADPVPLTQHLTARPETSQVPMRSLCT